MAQCTRCGEENPARARFCLACGAPITAAPDRPPLEERRTISVVFTDIVGSTASAEQLDPEDVRARLAPYYARVRREFESFGGTVEKFIGDAVVAIFGAPVAHEDDPERAVRAALAVRAAISELNVAGGQGTARRDLEGASETVQFPLPAVLTIDEGIARPRLASLKGIMAAKKKPLDVKPAQLGPRSLTVESLELPAERPPGRIVGEGPEAVPELVKLLQTEAKVL